MGSITFTGGTAAQQQFIQTGHGTAATVLADAISAAPQGGPTFVTWFGDDSSASHTAVVAVLTAMQTALTNMDFAYDLTKAIEDRVYVPIVVMITNIQDNQVSLIIDPTLWYAYDQAGANMAFVLGLGHQLCLNFGGASIMDRWDVVGSYHARMLAQLDPAAAQAAPFCYLFYLSQFLGTSPAAFA